jgi:hypothetical protein
MPPMGFDLGISRIVNHRSANWAKGDLLSIYEVDKHVDPLYSFN